MLQIDSKWILIPYILIGRTSDLPLTKDQANDHLLVISLSMEADIGVFYKCMDTDWHWCTNVHPLVGLDSAWVRLESELTLLLMESLYFVYFYRQDRQEHQTAQNNSFTFFFIIRHTGGNSNSSSKRTLPFFSQLKLLLETYAQSKKLYSCNFLF